MLPSASPPVALLDLDGTLVDRDAAFRRWAQEFRERWALGPEQYAQLLELDQRHRPRKPFFEAVHASLRLPAEASVLWQQYRRRMPSLTTAFDGVHDGLATLRAQGWQLAIVTNGEIDNQREKLRRTGLDVLVDAVCISAEVGLRKPDAALFQSALARCRQEAGVDDVWVLGDDPVLDVQGGRDAGLRTVWVSHGRSWQQGLPPDVSVSSPAQGLRQLAMLDGGGPLARQR
jgi:putative hydrolase of the HAD superfamily